MILLLNTIELIFLIYLGIGSGYFFIYAFAGLFYSENKNTKTDQKHKFAVFIPGYKEDMVIHHVASKALEQNYPRDKFDIIVIADSFKKETLDELKKLPLQLIEVSFELSTKSRALNKALDQIETDYDVALILDADNIMEPDFISKINTSFQKGYVAVQGHRAAKNLNTAFAILDAISEEINNHFFRKGHRALGLSSGLIGSGMAFEYHFFKELMSGIDAIGGFDKEMEHKILQKKIKIDYSQNAYVYDEKVQKADVFYNQRRRWLAAQFFYLRKFFFVALKDLFLKGNIDFFDKAFQMLLPPRILTLGFVFLFTGLSIILPQLNKVYWLILFTLTCLAFLFSIPRKFYNKKLLFALWALPRGFILMLLSILRIKGANKKFIHTEHTTVMENKLENK